MNAYLHSSVDAPRFVRPEGVRARHDPGRPDCQPRHRLRRHEVGSGRSRAGIKRRRRGARPIGARLPGARERPRHRSRGREVQAAVRAGQKRRLFRRAAREQGGLLGQPGAQDGAETDNTAGRSARGFRGIRQEGRPQGRYIRADGEALAAEDRHVRKVARSPRSRADDDDGRLRMGRPSHRGRVRDEIDPRRLDRITFRHSRFCRPAAKAWRFHKRFPRHRCR